jgi:hypothetical protein
MCLSRARQRPAHSMCRRRARRRRTAPLAARPAPHGHLFPLKVWFFADAARPLLSLLRALPRQFPRLAVRSR